MHACSPRRPHFRTRLTRGAGTLAGLSIAFILGGVSAAQPTDLRTTDPDGAPSAPATPITIERAQPGPAFRHAAQALSATGVPALTFISVDEQPEGDMPRECAYTPDGSQLLVVNRDTDNVVFFDTTTNLATATVPVGDFPVDIAITPDGQYAVVPNVFDHTVSIIDIASQTVAATVPVSGEEPFSVEVTSDSQRAIVAVINPDSTSLFSVIDLTTFDESYAFASAAQGSVGFFFSPETGAFGNLFSRFALAPDDSVVVLPDAANDAVVLYDLDDGSVVAALPVADLPRGVDISADSTRAVISHEGAAQTITVIDLTTNAVENSFVVGQNLTERAVRVTPDNTHAIAAISNNVIFVNLANGQVTATINTGVVGDIEFSHDGQYAFVSNFNARIIDIASQSLAATVQFAACAEAATSPTELRAVALNNRFREDVQFYAINGGASSFESFASSGEPEEGDVPYALDIAPDGSVAVVSNIVSRNVSILDLDSDTVRSYVEVGDRPKELRITPDGQYAIVCAMDADQVVIIDLATDQPVATLPIVSRPGRVRISPDGTRAYVLNIAGVDRVSFIELDGANSSILAQVSAGQTGAANGPTYTEVSGIELSPDGSILAVCDSFNDLLRLYDTAAFTQVAAVPTGDFPLRVAFSPDGTRAYVANHFGDSVTVVDVDGGDSQSIGTVSGVMQFPISVEVSADGAHVYVGTRNAGSGLDAVRVIDTASNTIVANIPLNDGYPRDSHLDHAAEVLYIMSTGGELLRIDAAGPASAIIDATPTSGSPADLAFNEPQSLIALAQPIPDGVDVIRFGSPCPADLNDDEVIDVLDLLALLGNWGGDGPGADLAGPDDVVNVLDLLVLLGAWGGCP